MTDKNFPGFKGGNAKGHVCQGVWTKKYPSKVFPHLQIYSYFSVFKTETLNLMNHHTGLAVELSVFAM